MIVPTPPSEIVTPVSTGVGLVTVSANGLEVKLAAPWVARTPRFALPVATPCTRPALEIVAFVVAELVHVPNVVP